MKFEDITRGQILVGAIGVAFVIGAFQAHDPSRPTPERDQPLDQTAVSMCKDLIEDRVTQPSTIQYHLGSATRPEGTFIKFGTTSSAGIRLTYIARCFEGKVSFQEARPS